MQNYNCFEEPWKRLIAHTGLDEDEILIPNIGRSLGYIVSLCSDRNKEEEGENHVFT